MKHLSLFILSIAFIGCSHGHKHGDCCKKHLDKPEQIVAYNFDWDDNIAYMPTTVYVFHNKTGAEKKLSTADFAVKRQMIGKSGELKNYKLSFDDNTGSFREFRDFGKINYFTRDVEILLNRKSTKWRGPSFKAFQKALSHPKTSRRTSIITARGHSDKTLLEGVKLLQKRGLVKHLPSQSLLYGVSHPSHQGKASSPSQVKVKIMLQLLDEIDRHPLPPTTVSVLSPDGKSKKAMHLWGFSDDDHKNYATAVKILSEEYAKGRWPNTKITLFFTGAHGPQPAETKVILPSGKLRNPLPNELKEADTITNKKDSAVILTNSPAA